MRTDIFGLTPRQHDMFGAPQGTFDTPMTLDEIRRELGETLETLRAAETFPWPTRQMLTISTMFPDIAGKLPCDEAQVLIQEFNAEMRRLRREPA